MCIIVPRIRRARMMRGQIKAMRSRAYRGRLFNKRLDVTPHHERLCMVERPPRPLR